MNLARRLERIATHMTGQQLTDWALIGTLTTYVMDYRTGRVTPCACCRPWLDAKLTDWMTLIETHPDDWEFATLPDRPMPPHMKETLNGYSRTA